MDICKAWCRETAHPSYQVKWTEDNPAVGQCCVTALIVQDMFGGDIYSCKVGKHSHYFNVLSEGTIIDWTQSQFENDKIVYRKIELKDRKKLLKNKDIEYRYKLLKTRLGRSIVCKE